MLERAATELLERQRDIAIVRLAPPGSCPRHFDLSPGMVPLLHEASLIVLHDYQKALDEKLPGLGIPKTRILSLECPDSLLIRDNYSLLLTRMAEALGKAFPQRCPVVRRSLNLARKRLRKLTAGMRTRVRAWRGTPIIAAQYQKEFRRWLGFRIVAVFPRPADSLLRP